MFGVVAWLEHGLAECKNKNYKRVWKWAHTISKGNWCIVLNITEVSIVKYFFNDTQKSRKSFIL